MCGAETWVDSEADGRAKSAWLKRVLPWPQGIPSHETVARGLARFAPAAVRPCLLAWLPAVPARRGEPLASPVVASDGTAARHRVNRARGRGPLHLVRAWATASPLVWGQMAVEQQSHESPARPTLRQRLELSGGRVTLDALGTQKEMAQTMIAQEADEGLALTGPQGPWPEAVALLFEGAATQPYRDRGHQPQETHTTGHGREERRRPTGTPEMAGLRGAEDGVGVQTVAMVEAWRTQGAVRSDARRSDLSRLGRDAKPIAESGRGHWALENALHGGLDSACREDDSRIRQGPAPEHFALLRPLALNLLTQDKTSRHGVNVKRNTAGWDTNSLPTVLGM